MGIADQYPQRYIDYGNDFSAGYTRYGSSGYSGASGVIGPIGPVGPQGTSGYSGSPATDHAGLTNLDYANAGHSGFQPTIPWDVDYQTYLISH